MLALILTSFDSQAMTFNSYLNLTVVTGGYLIFLNFLFLLSQ